jgi:hypothetical protein
MSAWLELVRRLDMRRLIPMTIVLGVLGAAVMLGMRANARWLTLAGVAVGGGILGVLLIRRIELGVLVLLPVSFLTSWGLNTGTYTKVNGTILVLALLIAVWLLRMAVVERKVRLVRADVNLPALVFVIVVGLSFLAGNIQWLAFSTARASTYSQIGGVLMLTLPVGAMLLVGNVLREERWLRWMVWLFLGLGGLYLAACWIPGGGVITGRFNGKAVSSLFYTWSTALSGGMLLFNTDLKGWRRWLMGLVLGLTLLVGIVQTRNLASNWVPPLITLGILVLLKWWRVGILFWVTTAVLALTRFEFLYTRIFSNEQYSAFTRAATFPIMLEMVKASPLLGLGPSNYYFYTPLFSLLGYYVQFNSHNNYWDLAAQVGLVGLGVFIWMAVMLAWMGWRLRRKAVNGFQHGYGNAMLAGFAGMLASGMMADWFMPFVYNIGFDGFRAAAMAWMFLGGLIALERLSVERQTLER